MTQIEIGRLLRAGTTGFIAGCRVNQLEAPSFGGDRLEDLGPWPAELPERQHRLQVGGREICRAS